IRDFIVRKHGYSGSPPKPLAILPGCCIFRLPPTSPSLPMWFQSSQCTHTPPVASSGLSHQLHTTPRSPIILPETDPCRVLICHCHVCIYAFVSSCSSGNT